MFALIAIALAQSPDDTVVRGMTLSTPTYNGAWASDAIPGTYDVLVEHGVNWVSYHPYAQVRSDGSVQSDLDLTDPPAWLLRPLADAHERGLKVMVKPHLAYWGSGFSWRGAIAFDDDQAQERFFREYRAWVLDVARLTASADAFVVGTELEGTIEHEAEWRDIIAAVRGVYDGHLTYAANWDRYADVPFWDAVDAIGVQAYFPLLGPEDPVTAEAIQAGWRPHLDGLHTLSAAVGKHVIFTELGYDATPNAVIRPWEGGRGDDATQALALATTLRILHDDPVIRGAFLWKWFPGELQRGDFRMSRPETRAILDAAWGPPLPSGH